MNSPPPAEPFSVITVEARGLVNCAVGFPEAKFLIGERSIKRRIASGPLRRKDEGELSKVARKLLNATTEFPAENLLELAL